MSPYRSQHDVLREHNDRLQRDLARAAKERERHEGLRQALEQKIFELETEHRGEQDLRIRARQVRGIATAIGILAGAILPLAAYGVSDLVGDGSDVPHGAAKSLATWLDRNRAHCNGVEINSTVARDPAPTSVQGQSWLAACYAFAGNLSAVRRVVSDLPHEQRAAAANVALDVIDPGVREDRDVALVAELLLEFTPDNKVAVFHAGMRAFESGRFEAADQLLRRFLVLHATDDGWARRTRETIVRIPQPFVLRPPPEEALGPPETPRRDDVATALRSVQGAVNTCGRGQVGTAMVAVHFSGSTGRVVSATVSGQFSGTPVGSCIARAVRAARLPRFNRESFAVTFPYRVGELAPIRRVGFSPQYLVRP